MSMLRSLGNLVAFVFLPFRGVNEIANWMTIPAALAAVGVPLGVSEWVRSDLRWLALAGWVVMALLVVAVTKQHFALNPLRGVTIDPLEVEQVEWEEPTALRRWFSSENGPLGHAFRATVEVTNHGSGRRLEAVATQIEGLNVPPRYGPVTLHWDLQSDVTKFIPRRKTWKLHVIAGGGAAMTFLGPGGRLYQRLDELREGMKFDLELRVAGTDISWSHPVELSFERYAVLIGDRMPVKEHARPILKLAVPNSSPSGDPTNPGDS